MKGTKVRNSRRRDEEDEEGEGDEEDEDESAQAGERAVRLGAPVGRSAAAPAAERRGEVAARSTGRCLQAGPPASKTQPTIARASMFQPPTRRLSPRRQRTPNLS